MSPPGLGESMTSQKNYRAYVLYLLPDKGLENDSYKLNNNDMDVGQ